MRIKVKDIAYLAGVSPATVSLVLNNKGRISSHTRQKILDVAKQYDYFTPDSPQADPARERPVSDFALQSKGKKQRVASKSLAIVSYLEFPSYANGTKKQFFHELCDSIQDKAMQAGYITSIFAIDIKINPVLSPDSFDGFIIFAGTFSSSELDKLIDPLIKANKPFVLCDKMFPDRMFDCIVPDNWYGGFIVGEAIANTAFTDIGYFRCDIRTDNFEQRYLGFVSALRKHGLQMEPSNVLTLSADSEASKKELEDLILSGHKFPRVIFAESDYLAIDAIQTFTTYGISVPDDISVIGFDNIHSASLVSPGLTTVGVHKDSLADIIVHRLDARIKNASIPVQKIFTAVHLVERASFICENPDVLR